VGESGGEERMVALILADRNWWGYVLLLCERKPLGLWRISSERKGGRELGVPGENAFHELGYYRKHEERDHGQKGMAGRGGERISAGDIYRSPYLNARTKSYYMRGLEGQVF